ncbi:DUF4252 domain-containing protein [Halosquirtibacter laminarini]|uniref:DUF4252 domain-containing protein n=1 Tax=Halosquirtibacter laminarini TaxID=3374600 RepID=A0AC61NLF5_9BACT|nr:DUF4252 domain-containing protein [Prolixibacteraceae bacterium]
MIKKVLLIVLCLFALQGYSKSKVVKYMLELSKQEGVSKTELTPTMFKLLSTVAEGENGSDETIYKNVTYMLIVNGKKFPKLDNINSALAGEKYEKIMDMTDDNNSQFRFYIRVKGKKITDFLMINMEKSGGGTLMYFECNMTMQELKTVTGELDVNVFGK